MTQPLKGPSRAWNLNILPFLSEFHELTLSFSAVGAILFLELMGPNKNDLNSQNFFHFPAPMRILTQSMWFSSLEGNFRVFQNNLAKPCLERHVFVNLQRLNFSVYNRNMGVIGYGVCSILGYRAFFHFYSIYCTLPDGVYATSSLNISISSLVSKMLFKEVRIKSLWIKSPTAISLPS